MSEIDEDGIEFENNLTNKQIFSFINSVVGINKFILIVINRIKKWFVNELEEYIKMKEGKFIN